MLKDGNRFKIEVLTYFCLKANLKDDFNLNGPD